MNDMSERDFRRGCRLWGRLSYGPEWGDRAEREEARVLASRSEEAAWLGLQYDAELYRGNPLPADGELQRIWAKEMTKNWRAWRELL